jgi:hypothetical protein
MNSNNSFEASGGWYTEYRMIRIWTRRLKILTVCWLFVSVAAIGWLWMKLPGSDISVADAISVLALCLQASLIAATCILRVRERPSSVAVQIPNPDYDVRKLY